MSDDISTNELTEFMKELAESDPLETTQLTRTGDPTVVNEDNSLEILYKEVGGVLDTCKIVSETLAERIEAGDNYEGTMMGFAQATDNLMKALKFLDAKNNMLIKHQLELEKMKQAHEYRQKEIEHRNISKGNSPKNVTNVFIGSRDEFIKQATLGVKALDAIDTTSEVILEE